MKKIYCLAVLLYTSVLYSQQISLTISDKFSLPNEAGGVKAGNYFYCLDNNPGTIHLRKYDENMKELQNVKVEIEEKSLPTYTATLSYFSDKLLFLYFRYTKDSVRLFLSEIDIETLNPVNSKLLFAVAEKTNSISMGLSAKIFNLRLGLNPEKTKLLVAYDAEKQVCSCIIDKGLNISATSLLPFSWPHFSIEDVSLDNKGNRFFSYEFDENKTTKKGILIINNHGKELFQPFNPGQETYKTKELLLENSRDDSKVYVYSNYYGKDLMEGIVLATLDAENLKINTPKLVPYPDSLKKQLYDLSFGDKTKGNYTVTPTRFQLLTNDEGAIALFGQPSYISTSTFNSGRSVSAFKTGPIIGIFINGEKNNFTVIPREDINAERAESMAIIYKNNFLCIYTELEQNFPGEKKRSDGSKFIVAAATFNSDGTMMNQQKLDPFAQENFNFRFPGQRLSEGNYLVPVTRKTTGMDTYHSNIIRWAKLVIE